MRLITSNKRMLLFVAVPALLLVAAIHAAPEGKGIIKGTVTSDSNAPIAGAKVIAFNLDTADALETKSDENGRYHLKGLPKGDYELTVVAEGFDLFGSEEIKVTGKTPVQYDIQMVELFQQDPNSAEKP